MAGSAWTNQLQNVLIIIGPNGRMFVYSGAPAAIGNLIASIVGTQQNDTPGNLALAGISGYQHANTPSSHWRASQILDGLSVYTGTVESGPWTQVAEVTYHEPASESSGNTGLFVGVPSGAELIFSTFAEASGSNQVVMGASTFLQAHDPNAVNSAETWHTVTPSGSWANITGESLEIRMMPDEMVALHGQLTIPTGVTGPANTIAAIGAAYRPLNRDEPLIAIETLSASPFTATAHLVLMRTTGNLDCFGAATSGNLLRIQSQYPLNGTSN